jgi:hypothetical protein
VETWTDDGNADDKDNNKTNKADFFAQQKAALVRQHMIKHMTPRAINK